MRNDKLEFLSDEFLVELYEASKSFGLGIYVSYSKSNIKDIFVHPCGWDFISFEYIDDECDEDNIFNYKFDASDISNGIYENHPLEGLTLKEILEIIGEGNWKFE